MHAMVNISQVWGTRIKSLNGLEGLLETVGHKMMTKGVRSGTSLKSWNEELKC